MLDNCRYYELQYRETISHLRTADRKCTLSELSTGGVNSFETKTLRLSGKYIVFVYLISELRKNNRRPESKKNDLKRPLRKMLATTLALSSVISQYPRQATHNAKCENLRIIKRRIFPDRAIYYTSNMAAITIADTDRMMTPLSHCVQCIRLVADAGMASFR